MKSMFRVRFYACMAAGSFLCMSMIFGYGPGSPGEQLIKITIPVAILGIIMMTTRCERCGYMMFGMGGGVADNFKRIFYLKTFFLPKKCPQCGCERY